MKLKVITAYFQGWPAPNASYMKVKAGDIVEVTDAIGNIMLKDFPGWFEKVEEEVKSLKKNESKRKN